MRRVVRHSYSNFARSFLDLFWFQRIDQKNYRQWVDIKSFDPNQADQLRDAGAIHLTPHFGNFEWGSLIWGFEGFHMHIVAQNFKNPDLTHRFAHLRQHSGHSIIPQRGAMLRLMKVLKRGGHVALLTDLNVKPGRSATVIQCFGIPTCVTRLHIDLAHRCQRRMAMGICEPIAGGRYKVRVLRVIEPPAPDADEARLDELAQEVWDVFEPEIRRRPELWMWMYKHWRYRPDDDATGYPEYSNRSGAFAKLLRTRQATSPKARD
jgi:lauroyl/myristoyl acyltransferase